MSAESAVTVAPRKAALAFIFVTIALDMLALGMIVPVFPKLIEDFLGGDTAHAARIYGYFGVVWALMQFVSMPVMGALSDRYGRRPVILISNFGLGLDYIVMALAPNLGWLLVGRVLSGICAASITTGMAYVADVTPAERRSAAFGVIGVAFGLGFVLGPAIGGLLGSVDARLPFWAAAAFSVANGLYGLLILPESLPASARRRFEWRRANPVGSLRLLRSHPELADLASVSFLANLAHTALPAIFVLYAMYRYGWTERAVGLTLAVVGVTAAVVQGGLVGPLVRKLGERRTLLIGLAAGACGFAVYAAARSGALFLAGIPLVALWGLAGPAVQSLMSRRVTTSEQGELQGANGALFGIAAMIGPGLFTQAFSYSIGEHAPWHVPGASFLVACVLLVAAFGVAVSTASVERSTPSKTR
jgi:DHA1 family tetracycline resistance protein-like MFS transporter